MSGKIIQDDNFVIPKVEKTITIERINTHNDEILKLMMTNCLMHMQQIENELSKMKLKFDETDPKEDVAHYKYLSIMYVALNDVLHVGYKFWIAQFPEHEASIAELNLKHKKAMVTKLIGICECFVCKEDKVAHE